MSRELAKKIRAARPTLKLVTPLSYRIIWIMALFNILLGSSMLIGIDSERVSASLIMVNELFSFRFWGIVFIGIGLLKFYALKTNNWELSRRSLLVGVAIKAAWSIALIVRALTSPGTVFLTLAWLCVAALQMSCYIFFMPPDVGDKKQLKEER